ncbi:MAG: hypothetical protein HFH08_03090 [Bacilli bacterium]|nr:hypothetical protein [Bacilli bacterium]
MRNTQRKTSGRYRFLFVNPTTKEEIVIACSTLDGTIYPAGTEKVAGADLTVLDMYVLENFEDQESLRLFVNSLGYAITCDYVPKFAYQHNGATNYLDLVYKNSQLYDLAILFHQYKQRFSNHVFQKGLSRKEFRKIISKEISQESLWKQFYVDLISKIHEASFCSYIMQDMMLGERAVGFIIDYLDNEQRVTLQQKEAFASAKYYLMDTFTAYKPVRGMIVSINNYLALCQARTVTGCSWNRANYFGYVNPFQLISEEQLGYLESHSSFERMSVKEKEDMILSFLHLTEVPWHQRTIYPLSDIQIEAMESDVAFSKLTYLEKIRFANDLLGKSGGEIPYQKKKI